MDRTTIDTYARIAADYANHTDDFWSKVPQPTFVDAFIAATGGGRVLDVGCGTGRDAVMFRRSGLDPVCLDASVAMTDLAAKKGLKTVLGDFAALPFRDGTFDGVWAYTSLLHVPKGEVEQPLAEIRRVLKPGSTFGIGLLKGHGETHKDLKNDGNARWFSYYGFTELHDLLERNGFDVTHSVELVFGRMTTLHFLARRG